MRIFILLTLSFYTCYAHAQFPPAAGQPGSTALHKDSSVFVAWATGCSIVRGYQDISNTTLGFATSGDSSMALGLAGTNGAVSLGDGGYALLTFANPISDDTGWDFAIFENSFSDSFLELAFVEVSSDGLNFFRFPATSYTQDTIQVGSFGFIDATQIDNLAGKYRALFGTPFDLQQLSGQSGLDIHAVTHIKIIDVVGCIQHAYATKDQYDHKINDPWNTPFASGGFDLDAVGVIHSGTSNTQDISSSADFSIYPVPAHDRVFIKSNNDEPISFTISNYLGQIVKSLTSIEQTQCLDVSAIPEGIYFLSVENDKNSATKKLVIKHE